VLVPPVSKAEPVLIPKSSSSSVFIVGFHSQRTRFARGIVFVIVCVFRNMTPS
jgi:hypothetical protein